MRQWSVDVPPAHRGSLCCLKTSNKQLHWKSWQSCCIMPLWGKQVASNSPGNDCGSNNDLLRTKTVSLHSNNNLKHLILSILPCRRHHLYSINLVSLVWSNRLSDSWCRLHHQRKVKGVNVVLVEGLTQSHFYKHYLPLRRLRTNYSTVSSQRECKHSDWLFTGTSCTHTVSVLV